MLPRGGFTLKMSNDTIAITVCIFGAVVIAAFYTGAALN